MERHFILPISLAAALHVGLLYGIRPGSLSKHVVSKEPVTQFLEYIFPKDVDPPPPDDPAEKEITKGSAEPAAPVGPEPPVIRDVSFDIAVPVRPAVDSVANRIPIGPPGLPEGTLEGFRANIIDGIQLDNPPRARAQIAPQYPFEPRRRGQTGDVVVEFVVDRTGHVSAPRIVRSSDPAFDEPTLRAVLKWRFEPGRRHGEIVPFRMSVPVVFSLNEG